MSLVSNTKTRSSISDPPPLKNIGFIDFLGNFYLDPKIQIHFEPATTNFWDRLKQEYSDRNTEEVQKEAKKIIQEIFEDHLKFHPNSPFSDFIQNFLQESCNK